MSDELAERVRFLRRANIDAMEHSKHGLLDHLLGTRQLLLDWKARPALCDAGLFHSIYGTEGYKAATIPFSRRAEVQQLIGNEAESLAWLFCIMRRETFAANIERHGEFAVQHRITKETLPLTDEQFHDLRNLTFANELEPYSRQPGSWRRGSRRYLAAFRAAVVPEAQQAFDKICPRWWEFWKC